MITMIRERRSAAADWNAKAAQAKPGEVWTACYRTKRAVTGGRFESYVAGPVRVLGSECPVEAFRGQRTLGEYDLDQVRSGRLFARFGAVGDLLERGDTAPTVLTGTGDALLAVPKGRIVTVEHRSDHPVYASLRFVVIGIAGDVQDFNDSEGPGRYVGDEWICLSDVTGVQL